jgi:hypothetical protein
MKMALGGEARTGTALFERIDDYATRLARRAGYIRTLKASFITLKARCRTTR